MDFWTRLEAVRERYNVLEHPFYQRWSAGELTAQELAHYAGEYHHAVVALAKACRHSAVAVDGASEPELRAALERHAAEEESHIELWDDFARAVGGAPAAAANQETLACVKEWSGDERLPLLDSLIGTYVIEAAQPAISATKREGLATHYSITGGPASAYFELHERLDVEHAAASRTLISERMTAADEDRLLERAERALRANWLLLDGVERAA
ncbi:MAG TPA: iron-containing redox enzyme family protein [Solirubrobacteraceae bacterium]|jgi:pyrroloquinoline-quinone synthase